MTINEKLTQSLLALLGSSLGDLSSYAFLACGLWLFFHVVFRRKFRHRPISQRERTPGQVTREVIHSLRSIAIFGLVTGVVVYAGYSGWTRLYLRFDEYGWTWFVLSIGLMIVLHDAYFYWTHRLMHHPRLFRLIHRTHHLSSNPTPWAAYAFSPAEAFIQAGIGPLIVFTIPVHPVAFAVFMTWQITFNVFGHCGYEIFPKRFLRNRVLVVLNSVTHHALHHEKVRANFGLYFNVWDRLMGTNHLEYEQRFERSTRAPIPELSELSRVANSDTLIS